MLLLSEKSHLGQKVDVRRMRQSRSNVSCGRRWGNRRRSRESSYGRVLYNYFRTYDPSTGRYLESDPIGLNGGLNTYGYAYQNPLYYYDPTGEFGIAGALGGIVCSYLLSKLTGCDYSLKDALVDGALGAAGAGLASKLNKLNRIRKLRNLARQKGMQSTGRRGYTESYRGANGERLNIKHRGASSPGLQQGSYRPRFDYRTRPGTNSSPAGIEKLTGDRA